MTLVIKNGSVPSKTTDGDKVSAEVSLMPGAQEAIQKAVDALAADPHAPSVISLPVNVLVYNEYPKHLGFDQDGKDVIAANAADEKAKAVSVVNNDAEPEPEPAK